MFKDAIGWMIREARPSMEQHAETHPAVVSLLNREIRDEFE